MRLKLLGLVLCLLSVLPSPAAAQLADPLSLAASGALLPFFSDTAAGFVSVLEITSPVAPGVLDTTPPTDFTNPIHTVFFSATCARSASVADVLTGKQAKAVVSSGPPLSLTFNGLAAIAAAPGGSDLVRAIFPFHSRAHWIDVKSGRLRELEPITLDTFVSLGRGGSVALGPPFVWNPLRSAASFVTPRESVSIHGSLYLICPRDTIQSPTGGGVFSTPPFPRLVNRDGSFGFPGGDPISGESVSSVRARVYDDDEALARDLQVRCDCLTTRRLADLDSVYGTAPASLGGGTVPVWYTELESTSALGGPESQSSFTGYWGLEVAGSAATLFHRLGNASLDSLSAGTFNPFGNR
jgi:hypothetical protein